MKKTTKATPAKKRAPGEAEAAVLSYCMDMWRKWAVIPPHVAIAEATQISVGVVGHCMRSLERKGHLIRCAPGWPLAPESAVNKEG